MTAELQMTPSCDPIVDPSDAFQLLELAKCVCSITKNCLKIIFKPKNVLKEQFFFDSVFTLLLINMRN